MELERVKKASFTVIGKEGSTAEGPGFIQRLWAKANAGFAEIEPLAKRDEAGNLVGVWGAMTDLNRAFLPWEGFQRGLYLAGAECVDEAQAPAGWTKWVIPGFEYLRAADEGPDTLKQVLRYMREQGIPLAGAVQEYTCPQTGRQYLYVPVGRL